MEHSTIAACKPLLSPNPAIGIDLIYPTRGHFIGFITRVRDAGLLRRAVGAFPGRASIPSKGAALPGVIPGVGWSDHWSFWDHDYPAFFVTDTLPFRYPYYHTPRDTDDPSTTGAWPGWSKG